MTITPELSQKLQIGLNHSDLIILFPDTWQNIIKSLLFNNLIIFIVERNRKTYYLKESI